MADNIKFLRGSQANLDKLSTFTPGAFYLATDSERLYYADSSSKLSYLNKYITSVANQSNLPTNLTSSNIGDFYYIKSGNILCYYSGDATTPWIQVNVDTPDTDISVSGFTISDGVVANEAIEFTASLTQVNKDGSTAGNNKNFEDKFSISKASINSLVTHQDVDVTVTGDKSDATDTKATIKTKLLGSNSEDSFSIEAGSNIDIDVTDSTSNTIGNIKINAVDTTYDLSSAAGATTIILKENGSNQDTITFAAGTSNNDIIVSGDTANKIDIAHKTYNTKTASGVTDKTGVGRTGTFKVLKDVTVENGHVTGVTTADITLAIPEDTNTYVTAVKADNAGKITITQNEGEKIVSGADLYYKIGTTNYYNQADITSAINNLVKDNFATLTNALTFKGAISNGTLPTSASIGDTYIIKTKDVVTTTDGTAKPGDILIANGTENSSGIISGAIEWIVVPGTEIDTTYTVDASSNKITLVASTDSGAAAPANRTITLADDDYVTLTSSGNTITANHKGYTAQSVTTESDKTVNYSNTFKAITGFTSDEKGHVTGVTSTTYTMPSHPDQTNNHTLSTDTTNKQITLKNAAGEDKGKITMSAGTAMTVTVGTNSVSYAHDNVSCSHTDNTSSNVDITGNAQNVISSITVNGQGHVTGYTTKKYKSTDTKYTLSGATVAAVTNGVSITDTLKTTGGAASGTSTFSIVSSNPTNLTVSGTGTEVSLGLVWGTF